MKNSFIVTIYNEEESIEIFINSLLKQSIFPDEVIIVDAKSTDKTVKIIKGSIEDTKFKSRFKILTKKGNRSVGRNEAIKNAKNEIILCSDAGCVLHKDWVKNISKPFEDFEIDVVSGFYIAKTKTIFEKSLSAYTCTMLEEVDPDSFLPSSRSVAFRKSAWEKVGGYPEWLDTCEDLVFDRSLKKEGFNFKFIKNAIVYWPQRKNIFQAFNQFFNYAVGDGMARYVRTTTPLLYLRYILGLILIIYYFNNPSNMILALIFILLMSYVIWSILKNYKYVSRLPAVVYLPLLQLTSDVAVISGMSVGLIKSLNIKK